MHDIIVVTIQVFAVLLSALLFNRRVVKLERTLDIIEGAFRKK